MHLVNVMRKNPTRKLTVAQIARAGSIILTLLGVAALTGCQGFSQSGSSQQSGNLVIGSASLDFGDVTPGTSKNLTVTATNSGNKVVNISGVSVSTKYFALISPLFPVSLGAGQSTTLSISFTPNAVAKFSAALSVSSDAADGTQTLALSGEGAGLLALNPSSEAFGSVKVGATKSQVVTITNNDSSSVSISQVSVNSSAFSISGISTPVSLGASQSTTFTVTFAPKSSGSASGTVTITSNGSNPTLTMSMSGTGVAPGALSANPTSLSLGSAVDGSTKSLSETITNTGGSSVTVSQVGITGTGFSISGIAVPVTLTGGQSATFTVKFAPTAPGAVSGNLTVTSTATNPTLTIPVSGTGVAPGALSANPTSLSFGNVNDGSTGSLSETITNTGGSSVTVSQVGITGTGFSISGIAVPVTLTGGQSATFTVKFAPTAPGAVSGNLTVTSTATNPTLTIPVSGTGVAPGALSANPTSLNFGSVNDGSTGSLSETITNTGGSSVTVSQVGITGTGFSVSGIAAPVTLTGGQSATFTVKFAPTAPGAVSGNLTVTSTATNPTLTIPVSGTGVATAVGQLSVSPSTLALGSVMVGSSGTGTGTVTASGASVTVTAASTNNSVFTIGGFSLPHTIPAGQSANFTITFSPLDDRGGERDADVYEQCSAFYDH